MDVTIPGALADHLSRADLALGPAAKHPAAADLRIALNNARRGRGRTLVIPAYGTAVLHLISAFAEAILENRKLHTTSEVRAARLWIQRAGHAPTTAAVDARLDRAEEQAATAFAATTHAVEAVEYAEDIEAAVDTLDEAETLYRDRAAERLRTALAETPAAFEPEPETIEAAEARYGSELVTEAEATAGTWRGAWIGEHPDAMFPARPDREQGSLFA
ncbi:DNA ligase [Streptomyces phage Alderaan]|nr:DNA ligase [Streptomyces phage Alderaan]